jgi:hypothetical protein
MTIPPLLNAIEAFRANELAVMLRTAGVADVPKNKEGRIELWARLIGDPARIRAALGRLNTRCRKALEIVQLAGGELRTTRFQSLLARSGQLKEPAKGKRTGGYNYYDQHPENAPDPATFEEVLAALLKYGLIWTHTLPAHEPGSARLGFEGGRFVYIPAEVARHLPPVVAPARAQPTIKHVLPGSARICQRDLYLLWSRWRSPPGFGVADGLRRGNRL